MIGKFRLCCSHLPHNFQSSYEYPIHYQSEDSRAHSVVIRDYLLPFGMVIWMEFFYEVANYGVAG